VTQLLISTIDYAAHNVPHLEKLKLLQLMKAATLDQVESSAALDQVESSAALDQVEFRATAPPSPHRSDTHTKCALCPPCQTSSFFDTRTLPPSSETAVLDRIRCTVGCWCTAGR
jgi:hypothetical protein